MDRAWSDHLPRPWPPSAGVTMLAWARRCRVTALSAPILCAAAGLAAAQAPPGTQYDQLVTNEGRVATTLTNYGYFGNYFYSRAASMEFPRNSGYEHLPRAGLWVGAHAQDAGGSFTGVTTGTVDAALGATSPTFSEFSPATLGLVRRSSLISSGDYDPDAVSEEDVIALYDDLTPRQAAGNPETHRPLGISVHQESYAWNFGSLKDILFLHFVVRNTGAPLTNVWMGLYTEFASGNKAGYVNWPPTAGDPGGLGFWYRRKWLVYEDSLRMIREHYCAGPPVPGGCQLQIAPPWMGLELLTPPAAGQSVTLAGWNFFPGAPDRDQDVERYAIMSSGSIQSFAVDSLMPAGIAPGSPDPIELLAIGPFANVASGDSIAADFAFVGGDDAAAIHVNGIMARRVFDAGYPDAPTATAISLASVSAAAGRVSLRWFGAGLAGQDVEVERHEPAGDWAPVGVVRAQASGLIEFVDTSARAGERYGYRLAWREGGGQRTGGEAWITVPTAPDFRLHGAWPNPARGDGLNAAFSLVRQGEVRIRLLDTAGRIVFEHVTGILEPGEHIERIGGSKSLAPGIYTLELAQEGMTASARAVVVR